jgi:hypothetical protein
VAGPTSFAPVIEASMGIVEASGGQYHVLVIIADGQVLKMPFASFWPGVKQCQLTLYYLFAIHCLSL